MAVADATAEYMRYIEHDRRRKPSTVQGYRWIIDAQIRPALGEMKLEDVTTEHVERWLAAIDCKPATSRKALVILHGIFQRARKVYKLPASPVSDVEKPPLTRPADIQVLSPEEVWALVRAAKSGQDAAIFLTGAFTGLRMGELVALRWRDIDFPGAAVRVRASYAGGALTTPKSGKVRSVPLAPDVADALTKLFKRELLTGQDDLVFPGDTGGFLDGSALRRRYKAALTDANLRSLRFHDLRHTFGTRMIAKADIRRVQEWMGHADIQTTMRYLHYAPREDDARLVAEAFRSNDANAAGPVQPGTS
jgi:integrase